jgi:ketosteroid isomerase-like protein
MSEARQTIDRMTACMVAHDKDGLGAMYAPDAVITTPDEGEIKGREHIVRYLGTFMDAFPDDLQWEPLAQYESGDAGIDEGWVVGTNTGPLVGPTGETVPPTGKRVRVRSVDIATVSGGLIVRHNFYFDQMELLGQLGLLPA